MKRKVSPLLLFPLIALITLLHIAWTPGLEKKHSPHLEKIIEAVEFVVESRMADFQTPGLTLALTTKDSLLFVGT